MQCMSQKSRVRRRLVRLTCGLVPRRLAVAMLMAFAVCWGAAAQGNVYAIAVGVSRYASPTIENLQYADKDAFDLYTLFKTQAQEQRLRLLTNERATRGNVLKTVQVLFSQAGPQDMVVFYFSGHGREGLFLAHDTPIYFNDLLAAMKSSRAGRKVIFADACFSGSFSAPGSRLTKMPYLGNNVMTFLSSRSYQISAEITSRRNGCFTECLLRGLKGAADSNNDRVITALELFSYVHPRVKSATKGKQIPQMWGNFSDNMVIADFRRKTGHGEG